MSTLDESYEKALAAVRKHKRKRSLSVMQQRLIRLAKNNPRHIVSIEWASGTGPRGGNVSYGARESQAAEALMDAGVFERISSNATVDKRPYR